MRISKIIKNPFCMFSVLAARSCFHWLTDKAFIRWMFRAQMNRWPDLNHPKTLNEKLQWIKLYDRRPEYAVMADKYRMRGYISQILGEEYTIPLIGVWDDPEQIDFETLPDQFVLKCNHNSGLGMYICHDKSGMDVAKVKRDLQLGLEQDYYLTCREWPYKNIPRKIICETYMSNGKEGLTDYKVHCFNGVPKMVLVCKDRFTEDGLTEDFFTESWEHLPVKRPNIPMANIAAKKPEQLDKMLEISEKLSENIPFLRVDFYIIEEKLYIGELTFFPAGGVAPFEPEAWDETFGSWIQLPDKCEE